MSTAFSKEQVRSMFLTQVAALAHYWARLEPNPNSPLPEDHIEKTPLERCNGLAFSILVLLDGGSMNFPAIDLAVMPHEDDRGFCEVGGEDYFEPGMVFNDDVQLHEMWREFEK